MEDNTVLVIFGIMLFIACMFELSLIGISMFYADEVECNLLWCTFKTTNNNIESKTIINSYSECYKNGIKINCSLI